jgi:hypothetical protein
MGSAPRRLSPKAPQDSMSVATPPAARNPAASERDRHLPDLISRQSTHLWGAALVCGAALGQIAGKIRIRRVQPGL